MLTDGGGGRYGERGELMKEEEKNEKGSAEGLGALLYSPSIGGEGGGDTGSVFPAGKRREGRGCVRARLLRDRRNGRSGVRPLASKAIW